MEKERRASVLAYCARICDPSRIAEAADAAFADLTAALEAAPADEAVDLDRVLLEATRDAAAQRVDAGGASASGLLGSRRSSRTCELMPTLLAARASGKLSDSDRTALERHLSKCAACRELAKRRDEAEQAFVALVGVPALPAGAQEPFAPGDPEPEVVVSRSYADTTESEAIHPQPEIVDAEPLDEPEAFEDPDPEAFEDPDPEPFEDGRLYDPPEFEPSPVMVGTEEFDALAHDDEDEADTRAGQMPEGWRDGAPIGGNRTRSRGPGGKVIAGLFAAGMLILAVGLVQLFGGGGGDDGGTATKPAAQRQNAAAQTPPAQPADSGPSRAELRTRARLRALGDRELAPGQSGPDVKVLQKLLGVSQTGNYGELTTFAVKDFQTKHDLSATGIADDATKRALAKRPRPPRQAPTPPAPQGTTPGTQGETTTPTNPQGQAPQPAPPATQAPAGGQAK